MVKMTGVMSLLYEHHSREFTTRKKKKEKTQTKTKDFENCFLTFLSPIVLCVLLFFFWLFRRSMLWADARQADQNSNEMVAFILPYIWILCTLHTPCTYTDYRDQRALATNVDVWNYRISLLSPYAIWRITWWIMESPAYCNIAL